MAGQRCGEPARQHGGRRARPALGLSAGRLARYVGRGALALLLGAGATACDGMPTDVELGQFAGGVGRDASERDARLVGTWSRAVFYPDQFGFNTVVTETRFTFRADGSFVRRIVTSDFTSGFADEQLSSGTWFTEPGGLLVLSYQQPELSGLQLAYSVEPTLSGTLLYLEGQVYRLLTGGP